MEQSAMKGHRDLEAWKTAMSFVKAVYIATRSFPKDELYGLTSQLRRAAVSVPSNIAEGYGRKSPREFRRFIGTSIGSVLEAETQLEIAQDLGFIHVQAAANLLKEAERLVRMLNGLRTWTEKQIESQS